jgi:hypothetical protein
MSRCSALHQTSEVQVTECFSNLLFSIRTHFAVDSALLEEFSFPKPPFIVAAHIICKRVSHCSCTAVTVISRVQFAIQSLGHCGCTSARETERVAPRACTVLLRAPLRSARARARAPLSARTRTHAPLSAYARAHARLSARTHATQRARTHARAAQRLSARTRAAPRARAERCSSADVLVRAMRPVHAAKGPRRASDGGESVIPTHPSHPFPPRHSHLLPPAGLAGGRRCSSRRAPRPRMSAHGCRPGPRWLPARLARGGCRHGWLAAAAGTAGPRRLPARLARGGCRQGRPAAVAGTAGPRRLLACPRRLLENGSKNA